MRLALPRRSQPPRPARMNFGRARDRFGGLAPISKETQIPHSNPERDGATAGKQAAEKFQRAAAEGRPLDSVAAVRQQPRFRSEAAAVRENIPKPS